MIHVLALTLSLAAKSDVKLYVLDGGRAILKQTALLNDIAEPTPSPVELSDPCFLIKHGSQWMLWDTGLPDSLIGHPQRGPMIDLEKTASMAGQLKRLGLQPSQIGYVAFSHLHYDHAGTANLFPKATWILSRHELSHALESPSPISVVPGLFSAYKKAKKQFIDGDYDVFGDGTVQMLSTPGHTPGHMCLLLRLAHSGNVILSGDLFHQRIGAERGWVATVNDDRAQTLASIARIKTMMKNLPAKLIIQHDPEDYRALPKLPGFLD